MQTRRPTENLQFRQQIKKQKGKYNKVRKEFLKYHPDADEEVLGLPNKSQVPQIEEFKIKENKKPKREHKLTIREKQMQRPLFESDYEKYEWLKENGCTNFEDRRWMTEYMKSAEFKNLYGADCEQSALPVWLVRNKTTQAKDTFNASNQGDNL